MLKLLPKLVSPFLRPYKTLNFDLVGIHKKSIAHDKRRHKGDRGFLVWYKLKAMERPPEISIIDALSTSTRPLSKNNQLLWHISEDLRRFKELTEGHPVIMGRKTFESIGKPLPNRTNIVITRNPEFRADSLLITSSFAEALSKAREREKKEIFVMGGAQIYTQALPFAAKLYITLLNDKKDPDTFLPAYEAQVTKEQYRQQRNFRENPGYEMHDCLAV